MMEMQTYCPLHRHTDIQTDTETYIQTDRQTDRRRRNSSSRLSTR